MNRRPGRATLAMTLAATLILAACAGGPTATDADPTTAPMTDAPSPEPTSTATGASSPSEVGSTASPMPSASDAPADPLLAVELTDVRTGDAFTLAELAAEEGPVLLQPMAIWCSSCRTQQHEVKRAHELATFTSVSLDVELSELAEDLARYATDQGWDWRFAVADPALYRLLQERFGTAVVVPPATPLIVIEADGTVRPLEFGVGVRSAEQLLIELGAG